MYRYGPTCLRGPLAQRCAGWLALPPPETDAIRADLVERVRREIAAGTYDTPAKWDAALERLAEQLG
jgi:hypothetical protein